MPALGHLSAHQLNEIGNAIRDSRVDPSGFTRPRIVSRRFHDAIIEDVVRIEHSGGFYFDFARGMDFAEWQARTINGVFRDKHPWNGGEHSAQYKPGQGVPQETALQNTWEDIRDWHFKPWVELVKQELEAPDVWSEIIPNTTQTLSLPALVANSGQAPHADSVLSAKGQQQLARSIQESLAAIEQQGIETAEQIEDLRTRLERVEKASRRTPLQYVGDLLLGAVLQHAVDQALDADTARSVWTVIKATVGPILRALLTGGEGLYLPSADGTNV